MKPDAVLSDYSMPGVNGVTLLQHCLAIAPEVKRCLLSGSLGQVTEAQRASISPCLFLSKPLNEDALERLRGMLEGTQ